MAANNRMHVVIPSGVSAREDLTIAAKMVLGWLLARKGSNWSVWWQQQKIADELKMAKRTVCSAMASLETCDMVYSLPHEHDGRRNHIVFTEDPSYGWSPAEIAAMRTAIQKKNLQRPTTLAEVQNLHLSGADECKTRLGANFAPKNMVQKMRQDSHENGAKNAPISGSDYILLKENTKRKEKGHDGAGKNTSSLLTNGKQEDADSFSSERPNFDGKTDGACTTPVGTKNSAEQDQQTCGKQQDSLHSQNPTPLYPPAPPTVATSSVVDEESLTEGWDLQTARRRWNRTKGLPTLKSADLNYIKLQMDRISGTPWSVIDGAIDAFAANEDMAAAGFPAKAFWKDPSKWATRDDWKSRQNAPGRFGGYPSITPRASNALRPASAPPSASLSPRPKPEIDFVGMWNLDMPMEEADETLYDAWDFRESIKIENFAKEWSRICQYAKYLRVNCQMKYVNLPWVLKKQPGVKKRNWERMIEGAFLSQDDDGYPMTREEKAMVDEENRRILKEQHEKFGRQRTPEEIQKYRDDIARIMAPVAKRMAEKREARYQQEEEERRRMRERIMTKEFGERLGAMADASEDAA